MMHVLSIIHYPIFGGPHNRNVRLAPILKEKGVETTVLLPDEPGNGLERLQEAGVNVRQMPLCRLRATRNLKTHLKMVTRFRGEVKAIAALVKELGVTHIQLNGLVNPHGALAAKRAGVPAVWQLLDTRTPMLLRHLLRPVVRRYAHSIMSTGQRTADEHPGMVPDPRRLVKFFPPVDMDLFKADDAIKQKALEELGIKDAEIVIGNVSNINPQKGHAHFIRAAAEMARSHPEARFVILGSQNKNHSEYLDGLWTLAKDLGLKLGENLIPYDPGYRVYELSQAFDIFWMTPMPNSEGIPTSMEEAMSLQRPVVSFDVGSISELVAHEQTGFIVNDHDPAKVAEYTMKHLMDPAVRAEMGARGRDFIRANASLDQCAQRHVEAYELASQFHSGK